MYCVTYMWSDPGAVARGTLGRGEFPEKGDLLRVAFNLDDFGNQSQYWAKNGRC